MCQSYKKTCVCGEKTAEIFFGRNILDEKSVVQVYCRNNPGRFSTKRPGADGDSIPGQDRFARLFKSYEGVGHNQGEAFYRRRLEEDEKFFLNIFLLIVYQMPGKRILTICR
jgi:hypothetical protein